MMRQDSGDKKPYLTWTEGGAMIGVLWLAELFGAEPYLSIAYFATASWWVNAVGAVIFIAVMLVADKLYRAHRASVGGVCSAARFVRDMIGRAGQTILWAVWLAVLSVRLTVMMRSVSESMAKIALLQSEILLPLILFGGGAIFAVYRPFGAVLRAGYLVGMGAVLSIVCLLVLAMPFWEADQLFPWQGFGYDALWAQAGAQIGTWCVGSVILLLLPRMKGETAGRRSLLGAGAVALSVKGAFLLTALGVFGAVVGGERSFLLYEMAKLVHFSQYIRRVEAVMVIVWVMVVFLAMVILVRAILILAGDLLKVADTRPLIAPIVLAVVMGSALAGETIISEEAVRMLSNAEAGIWAGAAMLLAGAWHYRRRAVR